MAKTIGIILVIASLCGLTWYAVFPLVTEAPDAAQTQPGQIALATATIQPAQTGTGTPTQPVASPTVNYSATDAQKAVEAAQINLQAAQEQARGEIEAAAIIATSQAQSDQSAQTVAQINADAQATKSANDIAFSTVGVLRLEAENRAKEIDQDGWKTVANIIMAIGIFTIGVAFLTWIILSWRARDESEVVNYDERVTENELDRDWLPPAPVQVNGANSAFQYEGPLTPFEAAQLVRAGALDGDTISFGDAGRVGIKRARWTILRGLLVPEFAEHADVTDTARAPIRFNAAGCELIEKMTGEK